MTVISRDFPCPCQISTLEISHIWIFLCHRCNFQIFPSLSKISAWEISHFSCMLQISRHLSYLSEISTWGISDEQGKSLNIAHVAQYVQKSKIPHVEMSDEQGKSLEIAYVRKKCLEIRN